MIMPSLADQEKKRDGNWAFLIGFACAQAIISVCNREMGASSLVLTANCRLFVHASWS